MLASTTSAASFSTSSMTSVSGERVKAIRPVRVDSRIPKGPISLRKESIRLGLADLLGKKNVISFVRRNHASKMKQICQNDGDRGRKEGERK